MNLLPLENFRAELGLHPWFFWGLANTKMPINAKCSGLTLEYSWQGSDAAGRDDIRQAIARAEIKLRDYLGFWPAPRYQTADVAFWSGSGYLPDGYVQALGVEQLVLLGSAPISTETRYGTPFPDTFTLSLPTTLTNPDEIAVFFAASDRLTPTLESRWELAPLQAAINANTLTITGPRWLLVRPILYESPALGVLDPANPETFVSTLEIYQRTTKSDGTDTINASFVGALTPDPCVPSCCDAMSPLIRQGVIRESRLGLVTPTSFYLGGQWVSGCCQSACVPDRVQVRYLAGYPLEHGQMAARWRSVVTKLAAAELKRRICACRDANERLHDLQLDMALEATETERYRRPDQQMNNPFGTRLGHIQAWLESKDHLLRRGHFL